MVDKPKDLGDSERLTAHEIFASAAEHARGELSRPWLALSFSGIAGGLMMGLTGLSTGLVTWLLGDSPATHLIAADVYRDGGIRIQAPSSQLVRFSRGAAGKKIRHKRHKKHKRKIKVRGSSFCAFCVTRW